MGEGDTVSKMRKKPLEWIKNQIFPAIVLGVIGIFSTWLMGRIDDMESNIRDVRDGKVYLNKLNEDINAVRGFIRDLEHNQNKLKVDVKFQRKLILSNEEENKLVELEKAYEELLQDLVDGMPEDKPIERLPDDDYFRSIQRQEPITLPKQKK